jgi:hypothetical protein
VLFVLYLLSYAPLAAARMRAGARIERHRLAWVGIACTGAYFVVPFAVGGSSILYERFLPAGFALLAVALAPRAGVAVPRLSPMLGPSMAVATLCLALPAFGASDRRFRDLDALLPLIERNSAVAQLDLTPIARGRVAPIVGAAGRVLAERGGRLLFSFTDAPTSPVVLSPAHQWNEPVLRLTYDPFAFSLAHDLRLFRYVLVHVNPEWTRVEPTLVRAFTPEARLVGDSGEWLLFESTLTTIPLTDPDPGPVMSGPTLHERLSAPR